MFLDNMIFIDTQGEFGERHQEYDLSKASDELCEKVGFCLVSKEDYEDDLIRFISETQKESDKDSMKWDLRRLLKSGDEFMFCLYIQIDTQNYIQLKDGRICNLNEAYVYNEITTIN